MADGEVKIHVSADADLKGIDEAAKKVEDLGRKEEAGSSARERYYSARRKERVEERKAAPQSNQKPFNPGPSPADPGKGSTQTASEANRGASTSQTASEANRRPSTPQATPAGGDPLDRQLEKLKNLRAEQRNLETLGDKQGATSVRRQADRLEKDIDREGARRLRVEDDIAKRAETAAKEKERTQQREAKEKEKSQKAAAQEEEKAAKAVTREMREQSATRKAGVGRFGRGAARVADAADGAIGAGGNFGGMIRAASATGNPVALIAAAVAAVGATIATVMAKERDKDTMQGMELRENSAGRSRQRARNASVFGSSGSLVSSALDAGEEVEARKAKQISLDEKAREKWHDPSTWQWFGLRKNEGTRESEKNQVEIADLEKQKEKDTQAAQKKYMEEEGGIELSALRNRSKRTAEGNRGAMVDEMKSKWLSKYKESMAASGSDSTAKEMADLTVQNELRDRQAQAGAGLVDARSGGAGIAAAARWSQGAVPGQDQVAAAITGLHQTVLQGNEYTQIKDHSKK